MASINEINQNIDILVERLKQTKQRLKRVKNSKFQPNITETNRIFRMVRAMRKSLSNLNAMF